MKVEMDKTRKSVNGKAEQNSREWQAEAGVVPSSSLVKLSWVRLSWVELI